MPDTSKVEVLFYKASSGAIFCLQGVGATLQIRFGDLLCIRLTCMAIAKLITFSVNASDSVYFSRRTDPVKRGMDDQLYHAFTFDPSKSLLQRYEKFSNFTSFLQTIFRLKMLIFNNLHLNNLYRLPQIKSPYLLIFKQRDEICPTDGISLLF